MQDSLQKIKVEMSYEESQNTDFRLTEAFALIFGELFEEVDDKNPP